MLRNGLKIIILRRCLSLNKKINIIVTEDGKVNVETDNYKGQSCVTAIKELFSEFLEVETFDYKSDYYEEEKTINSEVNIKL